MISCLTKRRRDLFHVPWRKGKKEREKKFFFTFYFSPWWVGVQFRVICLKLDNLFPGKYVISSMLSYHCSATIARFSNGKSFKAKACDLKDKRGMQGGKYEGREGQGSAFVILYNQGSFFDYVCEMRYVDGTENVKGMQIFPYTANMCIGNTKKSLYF